MFSLGIDVLLAFSLILIIGDIFECAEGKFTFIGVEVSLLISTNGGRGVLGTPPPAFITTGILCGIAETTVGTNVFAIGAVEFNDAEFNPPPPTRDEFTGGTKPTKLFLLKLFACVLLIMPLPKV
ncbi:unnamed protein product, partial [Rotaria magnacalcarata]